MPVSVASTARRRVDLEGVLVASSMSTSLVIVGRRQRRRRSGGAALLSSSSTRPSRSPGLALPDVHSRCMCCDCTGLEPICAAADQRVGLDLSRIDRRVSRFDRSIRDTSPPRIPNRPPSCSVWLLRVARGDTQRQIRPGPTSAPTISALFAASNVFDRTLMPTVVGLGRGRTSTCSMTSFAIHGTVTELDLQRRLRLFP